MNAIVADLSAQHAELGALLSDLDEPGWQRPSPCEGWTVADVVLHLAQTDEMAIASARGRFAEGLQTLTAGIGPAASADEGAGLMVANQRGAPTAELLARWCTGADELAGALGACEPRQRVTWVVGQLSALTLATTRLAETWIHTGDVFAAFGRQPEPTDRLRHIARLAWRTLPYAFTIAGRRMAGPVAFELTSPSAAEWNFRPDESVATTVRGDAVELCLVAGRRRRPDETTLTGDGPDLQAVLELVRTFA